MSIQKLAYTGDSKIIKNLVNRVNALIDAGGGGGGASSLSDLDDTSISSPTNGQVLEYDSQTSKWKNANPPASGVEDVKVDGTSVVVQGVANITTPDLDDLESVAISSPSNGQVLEYNNQTQKWENVTPSSGSSLTAIETTFSAYSQLPSADKQDANKIYFLNDTQSGTQDTPIDATTFTNRAENSSCMGLSVTNGKLTYVYKGGSSIGANSYRNIAIPSTVSKIKFKLTTGTSYSTGTNPNWVVCIGVKANPYTTTNWINPTDSDWLVKKEFDTRNSSYEDYLDLSDISTDCYLMIVAHGWTVTFDEITIEEPSAPTGNTEIRYKDVAYGNDSGGSSGSVEMQSTVIYEPTSASSAGSTYALSDSIDNYDFISIYNGVWNEYSGSGDKFAEDAFVPVHTFNSLYAEGKQYAITSYSSRYMHIVLHDTSVTVTARSSLDICKIVGHKIIGGGGSSSGHNYSTNEQVIGTWIDGKPLYEKTIIATPTQISNHTYADTDLNSADEMILVSGYYTVDNYLKCPLNQWETDSYYTRTGFRANKNMYLYVGGYSVTGNAVIVVQYTKTTN